VMRVMRGWSAATTAVIAFDPGAHIGEAPQSGGKLGFRHGVVVSPQRRGG
jgi:hypothetical protein